MRLAELANALGVELRGAGDVTVERIAPLQTAGAGALSFVAHPRYRAAARGCGATALLVTPDLADIGGNVLVTPNVYLALAKALELFHPRPRPAPGVHATAVVAGSAWIHASASIGPGATIGERTRIGAGTVVSAGVHLGDDCTVGENALIHPGVVVREGVTVGNRVVLQPGCVIGGDGFGFAPTRDGWVKIPQVGTVVLEDDVEVGANTTIDRATLGETRIQRGAKLDNLIQIAHNVVVGPHAAFAAQVGIAGSTQVGAWVQLGGQVGVVGHIQIGDRARIGAQSGVPGDVPAGAEVTGRPPVPHRDFLRIKAAEVSLPELRSRVRALEREVARLAAALAERAGE
ncbi:MAG: UDP-3-O-(3-hydroxymyristoyl)glucosamine N-acyltransferase [bacterium]